MSSKTRKNNKNKTILTNTDFIIEDKRLGEIIQHSNNSKI